MVVLLILVEPGAVAAFAGTGVDVALEACAKVMGFAALRLAGFVEVAEVAATGSDSITELELVVSPAPGAGGLLVWPQERNAAAKKAVLPQTIL